MKLRIHIFLFLFVCLPASQVSFAQGLKFQGNEHPINQRTSYSVFGDKSVKFPRQFNIGFDIALYPETQIGYIIRVKERYSNDIYNLFFDGQGDDLEFRFNKEGKSSLINVRMSKEELPDRHWFRMEIFFDLIKDCVSLSIDGRTSTAEDVSLIDEYSPEIVFGRSDHIIDVPSFAIKNLSVGDNDKYTFELRENEGNVVHNTKGRAIGTVSNPEWLINDAYHWNFETAFNSESVAGSNYNPEKQEVYYFNRDTMFAYNVRSGEKRIVPFAERCPVDLTQGTNFIDTKHDRLYVYEVHHQPPYDGPTVAWLDLNTYEWTTVCYGNLPTQLHHHGSYFDPATDRYTIFGGFGHMRFSKDFHSFDLNSGEWRVLEDFKGDVIYPRYFSSVGYLVKTNSIYIFGGMGNESGEQVVGRNYYYDLHKVDLNSGQVTKLWELPWKDQYLVPVRGMVIPDESCFYTLCYPEHFTNSFLRLYRFSLTDGSYEILGDSIPIYSDRITTNANLYYDEHLNNLYALVQEFDDDIRSDLKVYSLAFPPITAEDLGKYPKGGSGTPVWWCFLIMIAGLCIFAFSYLVFYRIKRKYGGGQDVPSIMDSGNSPERKSLPNSIYLFGDFMVRDRDNKDITYMFSARLKQTFCLILQYSGWDGISSQRLSNLLWPDKPEDKVKNSRGVTINHLRKALNELDGIELVYDKGCFKLVQSTGFYCDYTRCNRIIMSGEVETNRDELIGIITRGKFLKFSDEPLFDSFKNDVERRLEPALLLEMEKSFATESYKTVLDLAQAVFNIDPFNDEALTFQTRALNRMKMGEEARIRYQAFAAEYKKTMGNDYPHQFRDLT